MDGIIIINKEKGYTSNDVVQIVKRIFNEKVGHTGTLDPMATGVLPLLIGKGTKCSGHLVNHDKIYTATLKLGIRTDTGDITGKILEENKNIPENLKEKAEKVLKSFVGEITQIPPMYSAIKVNGKKLYEYARKGQTVEVPPRNIKIYDIELLKIENDEITFRVSCSKGTYIRTLCEDIAKKMGTIGTMSALNREKVGNFSIKEAITIGELKENFKNNDYLNKHFIKLDEVQKYL